MELMQAIEKRRSTRDFSSKQVGEEDLKKILLAGCAAPVGNGEYNSIKLTVVRNADILKRMSSATAKVYGDSRFDPFYGAPTVVVVSGIPKASAPGLDYANAACVIENMLLSATELNVQSVYLYGFLVAFAEDKALLKELGIEGLYKPLSGVALGYASTMPEERPLSMAFECNWVD